MTDEAVEPVDINEYRTQRIENLEKLKALGYSPFGSAFERSGRLAEVLGAYEEGKEVSIAGRLVAKREMGKSIFAHLQDGSGRHQVYLKKDQVGEDAFKAFKILDLGDHAGVKGPLFTTRTGEATVQANEWTLLSKSLLPLPEKWHGLQDVETRYRQRYLDLIANPEVRDLFDKRIRAMSEIRSFLAARSFSEVETPMMQVMAGGAAANPFETYYEALSTNMYLRIAPELYLKRLLVGGFDKVFELNRNFRNEGLSRNHNPEFTMLEIYQAYGDMRTMMELIQGLITHVAETVFGTLQVGTESDPVDLSQPWREASYHDLVKEKAGDDWFDLDVETAKFRAEELGCDVDPSWNFTELTQEIFEKLIEKFLIQPTFVTRLPAELVPLAKSCPDDPTLVDVFELIIGGKEIAPGYNELNDPLEQRKRFEEQVGEEAHKLDEEFLLALEHGMPPAGGMGIGIDRLIMLLSGAEAIRDVILFPQLKPRD
jgi:lysyl-tRNA synthetase class 2